MGTTCQAKAHEPSIVKGNHQLEQEVHVTTGSTLVQMHVMDWAKAKKEDPMVSTVLDWLKTQRKTDLKALLAEHASGKEGWLTLWNWQNFTIHQGALNLCSMPRGETKDLLLFMVPRAHHVATLNGCPRDVGHHGCDLPCPCCRSISGYQAWPIRCSNPLSPPCIACNMRVICPKHLYTQLWPPLQWTSCM